MVAALFKKNPKNKEKRNKIKLKKRVICRRCCVGGKCGEMHNRSLARLYFISNCDLVNYSSEVKLERIVQRTLQKISFTKKTDFPN